MNINFLHGVDHLYQDPDYIYTSGKVGFLTKISEVSLKIAKFSFALAMIVILILYTPSVWFYLKGSGSISEIIGRKFENKTPTVASPVRETYQPKLNQSLSREAKIVIPSIGVSSSINEATYENFEDALKKGLWRVPEFGTPFDRTSPTIIAAHRYGYLAWSNLFRKENSFYNLPKLEIGDIVEIYWRQRKYVYGIYAESKGGEIEDYSADLILYTCEDLSSPVRIFKYARLLEI